jgi:hypothetical protein
MKKAPCRQTLYARRVKAELIEMLGGKCELCPQDDPKVLEFDHILGRDYKLHQLSFSARMARYKREAADGLLRLLCGPCNLAERKTNDAGQHVATSSHIQKTADMPF